MTHRKTALALMLICVAFALAITGRMLYTHHREAQSGVLVNSELAQLKSKIATDYDPRLIEQIRTLDHSLRQDYFRIRLRHEIGGYMLAATIIGFVLSARWFINQSPKQPRRRARMTESDFATRDRRQAFAIAAIAILLFTGLGVIGKGKPSPYKQAWPNLRGPNNLGVAIAADYPTTWSVSANLNIGWKTAIPAPGKSSPIVWGDRVFLTGGDKAVHHVMCFNRADGQLLWDKTIAAPAAAKDLNVSSDAGFAASTAATDGKRVYAIFPTGLLVALDFDGNQIWDIYLGVPDNQYGYATSLIMNGATLIVLNDQGSGRDKKSRLIGIDAESGKERWSTPRELPSSWSTPALIKTANRVELITCADPFVISYDPDGGKELWRVKAISGDIVASPAFDGERVIVTTDKTLAIRPGGSGDVTKTNVAWKNIDAVGDIASPVSDDKRAALVFSAGTVYCINSADGKPVWEKSFECSITASPILVGQKIYLSGQDGVTRIFTLGDQLKLDSQGDIGEPIHVTAAFADGEIYIRGDKNLVCVKKK